MNPPNNNRLAAVQDSFYSAKASTAQHYRAATPSRGAPRPSGIPNYGVAADHWLTDESKYWYIVELARYFRTNDPIYRSALTRVADNVIGCGFSVEPDCGVAEIDDYLEADWELYCDAELSDTAGEKDLHSRAHSDFIATLNDGDIFGVPRNDGTFQTLENHRCKTSRGTEKNVLLGIEEDDNGKRVKYWLTRQETSVNYVPLYREIVPTDARDNLGNRMVWHSYLPDRVTQRRGVSVAVPVVEMVQMHNDIQYGKLFQQQAASAVTFLHELPPEAFNLLPENLQTVALEMLKDAASRPTQSIKAGLDMWSRFPGEKITGFSPAIPNQEFFAHVMLVLQIIGVNLGLPVQLLLLDPTKTNFSGWRGALDEARRGFQRLQKDFGKPWYRQRYNFRVRWLISNRSDFRGMATRAGWSWKDILGDRSHPIFRTKIKPPKWRYIQPAEDIRARVNEVGNHLISPSEDASQWGGNFWETVEQTVEDNAFGVALAKAAAKKINDAFPMDSDQVGWRDLWSPITGENQQVSLSRSIESVSDQPETEPKLDTEERDDVEDQ